MHNYGSGAVWLMGVILSILPILYDIKLHLYVLLNTTLQQSVDCHNLCILSSASR